MNSMKKYFIQIQKYTVKLFEAEEKITSNCDG